MKLMKRPLLFALLALWSVHPVTGQEWMERFLKERDEQEAARRAEENRRRPSAGAERSNEAERSSGAERSSERIPPPEATSLRDLVPAATPPPVRRAQPVTPVEEEPLEPAPAVPPYNPEMPVRRAQPVEPFLAPGEPATPPAVPAATPVAVPAEVPEPTPTPRPRTPREALEAPVDPVPARIVETTPPEEPVEARPDAPADSADGEEPAPESVSRATALEKLDPRAHEIRLSPGVRSAPADVIQFSYANNLYAKKDYDRAISEFERYLHLYNTGRDRQAALYRLAESYRHKGTYNAARKNYEALIYNYPMSDFVGPASYRLGEICFQEKDFEGAVTFFRKAAVWLKDPPLVLSSKYYVARSLEGLMLTTEAISAYNDVLAEDGENPFREASQLSLVELLSRSKQRTQALRLLEAIRSESKKPAIVAEATARIGLLLLEENQNAKAVEEFRKALAMPELGSWREITEIGLLRVLYNDGKYQEVLDIYAKSDGKFSKTALPEVLLVVGNSHRQLNHPEEANRFYDRIVSEFGQSPYAGEASYERLVALYNADSPDLIPAIDAYLEAHPGPDPKHDQLTLMKAEAYYKQKLYAQAAPVYAQLESSRLSDALKAEAAFKLGWCHAQTGFYDPAIEAFSQFLSRYPRNKLTPTALAQRGFCYEQKRDLPAALKDFDALLKNHAKAREREFALLHKALIYGQQEDNRRMVETFQTLLKEYPESAAAGQANYWIGLTALQTRDYARAIEPLTKARKLDKEFADRATGHLLAAQFALEDRDALAAEVDQADAKMHIRPEMLRWLGAEYLKAGKPRSAVKYYEVLLSREDPALVQPEDWLELAQAETRLGEWDKAIGHLDTYLEKVSDPIPKARGYLAMGRARLGKDDYDGAQEAARQVQQLQPEGQLHAFGRILAGDVAMARNRYEEAAKLFLSVSIIFEDPVITPQAMEKAYLAYRKAGDAEKAGKTLNDLQTRYPEYQIAQPTAGLQP